MTIWDAVGAVRPPPAPRGDRQRLSDSCSALLAQTRSQEYTLVEAPAPGALRLQAAITHGATSPTALAFAGESTLEVKIQDAHTGAWLAAEADRRVGGTHLFDTEVCNARGDVHNRLACWADAAVYRLCVARGGAACVTPNA